MEWVLFVSLQWVVFGKSNPAQHGVHRAVRIRGALQKGSRCHQNRNRSSVSRTATRSHDGTREMPTTGNGTLNSVLMASAAFLQSPLMRTARWTSVLGGVGLPTAAHLRPNEENPLHSESKNINRKAERRVTTEGDRVGTGEHRPRDPAILLKLNLRLSSKQLLPLCSCWPALARR